MATKLLTHSQPAPPKSPNTGCVRISLIVRIAPSPSRTRSSTVARVTASSVSASGNSPVRSVVQRRGDRRSLIVEVADVGRRPAGHQARERHQHQHVTRHRRIEQVVAESAIGVLHETDREHHAAGRHPPGAERWQGKREQQCRNDGAAIAECRQHRLVPQPQRDRLGAQRNHDCHRDVEKYPRTIKPRAHQDGRQQREDHDAHHAGHARRLTATAAAVWWRNASIGLVAAGWIAALAGTGEQGIERRGTNRRGLAARCCHGRVAACGPRSGCAPGLPARGRVAQLDSSCLPV